MDPLNKAWYWAAIVVFAMVCVYYALDEPEVPDCCLMGMDTTCLCYERAQ